MEREKIAGVGGGVGGDWGGSPGGIEEEGRALPPQSPQLFSPFPSSKSLEQATGSLPKVINFKFLLQLTRNYITSHSVKNLAFHKLRQEHEIMCILLPLTLILSILFYHINLYLTCYMFYIMLIQSINLLVPVSYCHPVNPATPAVFWLSRHGTSHEETTTRAYTISSWE